MPGMRPPSFVLKYYIRFVSFLARPYLRPQIASLIEREEREQRKKDLARDTSRPLAAEDVKERWRHGFLDVKVPCRLGRVFGGRKPHIELRITNEILQRLTDTKWEAGLTGRTIDVIFRVPQDLAVRDESAPVPASGGMQGVETA